MNISHLDTILWQIRLDRPAIIAPQVTETSVVIVTLKQGTRYRCGYVDVVDKQTGAHCWSYEGEQMLVGGILATPIVVGERLILGTGRGYVHCLDAGSGELIWSASTNEEIYASLTVVQDQVIAATTKGSVTSFSLDTGDKFWSFKAGHSIYTAPVIVADQIIIASWDGHLYGLSLDGIPFWNVDLSPARPIALSVSDNYLLIADSYENKLRTFRTIKSTNQWQLDEIWRFATGEAPSVAIGLVMNLVFVSVRGTNSVTSLGIDSGKVLWTAQSGTGLLRPVIDGERLIVITRDGQIIAYDFETGAVQWHLSTAVTVVSDPTVSNGVVYLGGNDKNFYAIAIG